MPQPTTWIVSDVLMCSDHLRAPGTIWLSPAASTLVPSIAAAVEKRLPPKTKLARRARRNRD